MTDVDLLTKDRLAELKKAEKFLEYIRDNYTFNEMGFPDDIPLSYKEVEEEFINPTW